MKPLKRTGRCDLFLVFDMRVAVTSRCSVPLRELSETCNFQVLKAGLSARPKKCINYDFKPNQSLKPLLANYKNKNMSILSECDEIKGSLINSQQVCHIFALKINQEIYIRSNIFVKELKTHTLPKFLSDKYV